jgi:hypothetical protein
MLSANWGPISKAAFIGSPSVNACRIYRNSQVVVDRVPGLLPPTECPQDLPRSSGTRPSRSPNKSGSHGVNNPSGPNSGLDIEIGE